MADPMVKKSFNPEKMNLLSLLNNPDLLIGVGVIGILIILILPIPAIFLDFFLSFSLISSLIILLLSVYTLKPLDFSVFPSVLLINTLFRLSLNIASTKLILLYGDMGTKAAGQLIHSFGEVIIGGSYVVGLIVFVILIVINFMVITKGAGRVAEVAARFTLDSMPGKQMSIDADLNAGNINESEARRRRVQVAQEADFYGAMDGASKFVRGDAIAAIIITFVNIIGGFLIGVFQKGMPIAMAAQNYTLLTIGDGLVSQVPALIVSTAAGIIVTRTTAESNLGTEISKQFLFRPQAIALGAGILFIFGLIPGLPHFAFIMMAGVAGYIAYLAFEKEKNVVTKKAKDEEKAKVVAPTKQKMETITLLDILELEIGYALIPMVDTEQKGDILERIKNLRHQLALEIGIIIPAIHVRDNLQLKPNEYMILLKGAEVGRGDLIVGNFLAMNPGTGQPGVPGISTKEPAFGLPALWVTPENKERAQFSGYTVVDPTTVLITHLSEVIRSHAHELLTRQEAQNLINNLAATYPKVVEELIPHLLPLGVVVKVMQNLLREKVSIRDLLTIFESLADHALQVKDAEQLTEHVRVNLARHITRQYISGQGELGVLTLDPQLEKKLNDIIIQGQGLNMLEPLIIQNIFSRLKFVAEQAINAGFQPIILCSPLLRPHFKKLGDRFIANLVVLSPNEITSNIKIRSLGVVNI